MTPRNLPRSETVLYSMSAAPCRGRRWSGCPARQLLVLASARWWALRRLRRLLRSCFAPSLAGQTSPRARLKRTAASTVATLADHGNARVGVLGLAGRHQGRVVQARYGRGSAWDRVDKMITDAKPWDLAKDENQKQTLGVVLYRAEEALRPVDCVAFIQ